jgi:hypothetical protein
MLPAGGLSRSAGWHDHRMTARGTARGAAALALAVLAGSLVGCADDEPAVDDSAAWRTSTAPVATGGLAWAAGSTVHLADGTTVDTGTPVRAFLVGGDGVFFVPAEGDDDVAFTEAPLWFAAPGSEAEDTGLTVSSTGVAISPDGSALAVLDADTDEGSAVMRLFDLSSGEETTSEDGMDTSGIDDPVDHLLESEVEILGITDQEVAARVINGDWAYDLATGDGRALDGDEPPGVPDDPELSPDGAWRIDLRPGLRDALVAPSGDEVVPDTGTPRWTLSSWVDADTVLGVAVDGPGEGDEIGPDDTLALVTCEVPSGDCRPVDGTSGERVVLPLRTQPTSVIDLRPREAS